ncbi:MULTISPECIES: glycosyltransferase [Blautia]|uniref:glycosyltransferase n=1 Tax=Blautia TaxID=572511 RepID=UPI00258ABFD1|nr:MULTISPECIES: glycosyltransferase [Blautia]
MIKVLILTNSFAIGGTEAALNSLLKMMNPEEYQITVLAITKEGPLLKEVPGTVKIKQLLFTKSKYRIFVSGRKEKTDSIKTLAAKIEKKYYYFKYKQNAEKNQLYEKILEYTSPLEGEYDLLLDFHGYGYFLTAYGAECIKAKKKAMWIHDENIWWLYKVVSYLGKYDKIFCVSQAVKTSLLQNFPEYKEKAEVFYNVTDTERIKRMADDALNDERYRGNRKILTIGRMEEQKGYDVAIEAAEILKNRNIAFQWFFMGDGNLRQELEKIVKKKGLEKNIIFLGKKSNPYPYIKNCNLYVQPSRHEGYATTILEARVLKKIIVASDIPSNREQIKTGINGYLEILKGEAFAERIEGILQGKEHTEKITGNLENENLDFAGEMKKLDKLLKERK